MTFFSILFALLIEQLRPLRATNPVYNSVKAFAEHVEKLFNAGEKDHGVFAWFVVVLSLVLPVLIVYGALYYIHPLIAFIFNLFILYLTLGFRHYSHFFNRIQLALNSGDEETARQVLAEWSRQDTSHMDTVEIVRLATEKALITTHRNVFGVFFWALLPIGPAGAVLYRVSESLYNLWYHPNKNDEDKFGAFAQTAFYIIDWIPARLTAIAFAAVGNFEDAVYSWKNFSNRWKDKTVGVILASGSGALNVKLDDPQMIIPSESLEETEAAGTVENTVSDDDMPGETPSTYTLQSTVGLVWRSLLLWMILLLLISFMTWVGSLI